MPNMNRPLAAAATIVITLIAAAILFAACAGSNEASSAGPMPGVAESTSTEPEPETAATAETETVTTTEATDTGLPPTIPKPPFEDGRHFGYIKAVDVETAPDTLVFDLAYFYTGADANREAAERGYPTPVDNDIFIVNENPRLRTLVLAPDVEIHPFDWRHCCEKFLDVGPERFASFFGRPKPGVYPRGEYSSYWLTVAGGRVVKIEEQFRP
jgi:hypothetical protein